MTGKHSTSTASLWELTQNMVFFSSLALSQGLSWTPALQSVILNRFLRTTSLQPLEHSVSPLPSSVLVVAGAAIIPINTE
jgi:hypothetical protein